MLQFFSSFVISGYNRLVGNIKALGINPSLIGGNSDACDSVKPAKPSKPSTKATTKK